jgi:phage baseplate assembly protein W
MTSVESILSLHWQKALGAEGIVEGVADIDQAIRIILGTPKGSDPHRPDFGTNIWLYIDWPAVDAVPHVVREISEAVRKWEPRATLVRVDPTIDGAHINVRVLWKLAPGIERETKVHLW